jgi:hypothetical protein
MRMSPSAGATEKGAPWFARPFVVAVPRRPFGVSAVTVEAWPLTSWRLFSHLRHDEQSSWQAFAVDGRGREVRYLVAGLGSGFHGFVFDVPPAL